MNAIALIALERQRQIEKEGHSAARDDAYTDRQLACAASCYVEHYCGRSWLVLNSDMKNAFGVSDAEGLEKYQSEELPDDWPDDWMESSWKPKTPIKDLVRAAALIAAEIDRLQRIDNTPFIPTESDIAAAREIIEKGSL